FLPLAFNPSSPSTDIQAKSTFLDKETVQKEVKATLSQKATISCEVADIRADVKWYKDGKLLNPSRAVRMESKGKIRQLVIDSVEKKDAGEYFCEAGSEKLAFKLQITAGGCGGDGEGECCFCL
uniref:Ig-like domain-containing protein n=1 Tax=Labrus bergylta TaxID=56723 RepID=A0A3Q3E429_9LABR